MTFEEYLARFPKKPSKAKKLILEQLWRAGSRFPRNWVQSSRLLALTGQAEFARRVRELRRESGCDIETGTPHGEHSYRLRSDQLLWANLRLYLTATQKRKLFQTNEYTCKICGKKVPPGVQGLQADHKVPLSRGGSHDKHNWQPICNVCNVGKRRACEGCTEDCRQCPWAFPDKFGTLTVVRLPTELQQKVLSVTGSSKKAMEELIIKAIKSFLKKE